jgi:hypothetical protein
VYLFLGEPSRVLDRLLDIFLFQVGIAFENLIERRAMSDLAYYYRNWYPHTADTRSPSHDLRIKRDSVKHAFLPPRETGWSRRCPAIWRISCSSSRTRTRDQNLMPGLKGGNRLLASDGRKCIQKLINAVSTLKIVEKVSQRHACANKYRRSAQDFWVAMHYWCSGAHTSAPLTAY